MLTVWNCIESQHDWRQVLLAAAVCFLTSVGAVYLFTRARTSRSDSRLAWLLTAGFVTGVGTWATHFIAMLAYRPGFPVSYDPVITVCSLIAATVMTTAGFSVALVRTKRGSALAGGALIGAGIACMHYTGMASMRLPATVVWLPGMVVASILLGVVFGAAAMLVARRSISMAKFLLAAVLLTLAICVHHFVAMAAIQLDYRPEFAAGGNLASPIDLWLAIAAFTITVVITGVVVAISDQLIRKRIRKRNRQLNAALNNMGQGLCMYDAKGLLELWNDSFLRMYDIAPEKIFAGATVDQVLAMREAAGTLFVNMDPYLERLRESIERRVPDSQTAELHDGRTINIRCSPVENGGWVATHTDITDRKLTEARINHLALHDPITDLPNRVALNEHLAQVFGEAAASQGAFAIARVDIDGFKEINDVFGQASADAVLCELARRLGQAGNGAFLARPGGDEFCLVSPLDADLRTVDDLCGRLSAVLDDVLQIDGQSIRVRCSIGICLYPQDAQDVETLIANADLALYRAKAQERGTIRFFEAGMDEQIRDRRLLLRDLVVAIENGQFELYYQPQSLVNGTIVAFEVLIRWRHPERGLVSPTVFIPLAEEAGLIGAIDEWVVREACREAATWANPLSIAVNLSPVDFQRGNVPAMLAAVLAETGLSPRRLEIEITEGVLIDDFDGAIAILRDIKMLGMRVAMDDFGTGYSSLSYLQAFAFDKIKIDKTFVSNIEDNPQSAAIVHAIIGLGRSLRLPVIAEGVETMAQLSFLADEGCAEVQGYLIGRPQPIARYRGVVEGRVSGTLKIRRAG